MSQRARLQALSGISVSRQRQYPNFGYFVFLKLLLLFWCFFCITPSHPLGRPETLLLEVELLFFVHDAGDE